MSSISLSRLENLRRYKDALRVSTDGAGIVSALPSDWLSSRGLTRSDVQDKLGRMFDCAGVIECQDKGSDENGDQVVKVLRANWCKVPAVCPICSTRTQQKRRGIYTEPIRAAVSRYRHAYMITFTVADGPDLAERLDHLRASFRAWYRMGQRRKDGTRSNGEAARIAAMLTGVELVKTSAGLWHVHMHALAFSSSRLDYRVYDARRLAAARREASGRRLSAETMRDCVAAWGMLDGERVPVSKLTSEWIAVSGDSCNVDVRPLVGGWLAVQHSALEVLKYSSKLASVRADGTPGKMAGADLISLVVDTHGRRLFAALREFRGLMHKSEYDDPGHADRTLVWDYTQSSYGGARSVVRHGMRAGALAETGKMVGEWRRERRRLLGLLGVVPDLAAVLDGVKADYRQRISGIWRSSRLGGLVDSMGFVGPLLPSGWLPPAVPPLQVSLFAP
jgi:hypothetical protein